MNSEGRNFLDSQYASIQSFEAWSSLIVDDSKWEIYRSKVIEASKALLPGQIRRAQERITRIAAIETGQIEGLYSADRGSTFAAATDTLAWKPTQDESANQDAATIMDQIKAYESVIEFASQRSALDEEYIRQLHTTICASQITYKVETARGIEVRDLPHGEFKHEANRVRSGKGHVRVFAPVEFTQKELERLVNEINGTVFSTAHAVLQASYAHYAFAAIHPFADGNGRVARALASIFMCRSHFAPLLITRDTKTQYLDALAAADIGDIQAFADYIFSRAIEAMTLMEECLLLVARSSDSEVTSARVLPASPWIDFPHDPFAAANRFFELFSAEMLKQALVVSERGGLSVRIHTQFSAEARAGASDPSLEGLGPRELTITLTIDKPVPANVTRTFSLHIPANWRLRDELLLGSAEVSENVEARMEDLLRSNNLVLEIRLSLAVERIVAGLLQELYAAAEAAVPSSKVNLRRK